MIMTKIKINFHKKYNRNKDEREDNRSEKFKKPFWIKEREREREWERMGYKGRRKESEPESERM